MYLEEMLPEEMDEIHFDQLLNMGRFSEYDDESEKDDVEWEDSEEDEEESEEDEIDLEEAYEFLYDDDAD